METTQIMYIFVAIFTAIRELKLTSFLWKFAVKLIIVYNNDKNTFSKSTESMSSQ